MLAPLKRGARVHPVRTGSAYGSASASVTIPASSGTRQRLELGLATVATIRRPSLLAEMDMYCSTPGETRVVVRRLMSSDQSHGPAPAASRATYNAVRGSITTA